MISVLGIRTFFFNFNGNPNFFSCISTYPADSIWTFLEMD